MDQPLNEVYFTNTYQQTIFIHAITCNRNVRILFIIFLLLF